MTTDIFRKAALQRLGSPERVDRATQLVRPRAWAALVALIAAMLGVGAWAVVADAPVKLAGQGILFEEGMLMDISSAAPGRIVRMRLEPGAQVAVGEEIAVIGRPDLELDLAKTRADLSGARERYAELQRFQTDADARETRGEDDRLETVRASQAAVARRVALLEEKVGAVQDLARRNLVVRDRIIDSELELANARERVAQLEDETRQIAMRRLDRQSKNRLALLDEQLKVSELERRVARLQGQIGEEAAIRSPHAGRVAEIKASLGDVVQPGATLATLIRETPDAGTLALVYVSPRDGRRIRKGMRAEVSPSITLREEFGFVDGVVEDVAEVASTASGMRAVLKNEQLARKLAGEGAPIAVRVRLAADATTPSGLRWSSSRGPAQRIPAGTLLTSEIIVERVPILSLIAPRLDAMLAAAGR